MRMALLAADERLAAAEGHWDSALSHFEQRLALADSLGLPVQRWKALREGAELYAGRAAPGDHDCALEMLREARAGFEGIGAAGWVARVDQQLDALGLEQSA